MANEQLTLYEEAFLFSLNGIKRLSRRAIGACIIGELAIRGFIAIEKEKDDVGRTQYIARCVKRGPVGDIFLDEVFNDIRRGHPLPISYWIQYGGDVSKRKERIAQPLVLQGIITRKRKISMLFSLHRYRINDIEVERSLVARIQDLMEKDGKEADLQMCLLLAILWRSRLLPSVMEARGVEEAGLKRARATLELDQKVKRICSTNPISHAVVQSLKIPSVHKRHANPSVYGSYESYGGMGGAFGGGFDGGCDTGGCDSGGC